MGFRKIKSIYKKEMLDLMRDKKTMIMMVIVPLLLYPLIMIGAMVVTSFIMSDIQSSEYKVVIDYDDNISTEIFDKEEFENLITDSEDELEYHLNIVESENAYEELMSEDIDAYVSVGETDGKIKFSIQYLSSVTNSSTASDMLEDKLNIYRRTAEAKYLSGLGLDAEMIMNPIETEWNDKSTKEESLGSILGSILPFLLIVSILMGAMYPAIDTTTGEKERGTLETLLTMPVKNNELIMGKFLAVATVAVISALLNLISMGGMGIYLYNMMEIADSESVNVNLVEFIPAIFVVILCVIAFALFISAITMCVTIFAKSFKEANNYLTPLLLVVMFTGYIGFIPNIEFNTLMASVPVVNICLLINNILVFKFSFTTIFVTLITNVIYAGIAIMILSKLYNSEEILFGEGGVSLQMFTDRKNLKKGRVPNFSDALLVAAVVLLLCLYVGSIAQVKLGLMGLLITQLIILGVPVFAAWYTKKDFKETFSIKMPKVSHILGAVLLEIGTFIVVMLLSAVLSKIFVSDIESVNESFQMILDGVGFIPALFVIALAPAICEEALFRGYMLSSAVKKYKPVTAVLIVAALFGIYHMSLTKFFTTGLLGIAFAFVVCMSNSILCSSIMHFLNNAASVVVLYYGDRIGDKFSWLITGDVSIVQLAVLLVMAAVFIIAGVFCLRKK